MDAQILQAMKTDRVVDITTTGRKSGKKHRLEIALIGLEDGFVLSGGPGRPRDWYANLIAHPEFTVHLKKDVKADIPCRATPVTDPAQRRDLIQQMSRADSKRNDIDIQEWVDGSPLIKVDVVE